MLDFLRKIGRLLKKAGDDFEMKCPGCGKVFKGQGIVHTCDRCGTRVHGSDS